MAFSTNNIGSQYSSTGTILAYATANKFGQTVTANNNGTVTTINVLRDQNVGINDVILVQRIGSQWWCVGRAYAAAVTPPSGNEEPPDPQPPVTTGTLVVAPVETRSYRNGAWRTDITTVIQGEYGGYGNHTGAVFYGNTPASLSGATVLSATIKVRRDRGGDGAARQSTMRLMTNKTKPAGAPTLTSSTNGPNIATNTTVNAFTVPTAWVQAMVDGTAGGLAFADADGTPYIKFAGTGDWSSAFVMTINWQRG